MHLANHAAGPRINKSSTLPIHTHRAEAEDVPEDEVDERDPILPDSHDWMYHRPDDALRRMQQNRRSSDVPEWDYGVTSSSRSKTQSPFNVPVRSSSNQKPSSSRNLPSSVHTNDDFPFLWSDEPSNERFSFPTTASGSYEKHTYSNRHELHELNGGSSARTEDEANTGFFDQSDEDSPYSEVRASVSNIDDPTMPTATFRVIVLSLILSSLAGMANTYLMLRFPAPTISPILIIILGYPLGKLMAWLLPTKNYHLPQALGGHAFSLNPGAFNIKEHTVIAALATISIQPSYVINSLVAEETHFGRQSDHQLWADYLFTIAARVIGFGIAGGLQLFLVKPASMLWPQILAFTTILNTLHAEDDVYDKRMSRMKWFILLVCGSFVYHFIPAVFIKCLTMFCWLCWIKPWDRVLNIVTGVNGMGLLSFTFNWGEISFFGSPMVAPWWSECNFFGGFMLFAWIIMPALYFTNTWASAYFPFAGHNAYDKFGDTYRQTAVLDPPDYSFNSEKFLNYSPLFLSIGFLVSYFGGFASITAVLFNMGFNHYNDILSALRFRKPEKPDIHAKLMRRYKNVPSWWYYTTFFISFLIILIVTDYVKFRIQVVAIIVSLLLPILYSLPSGFVYAMTGQMIGTNIIADVVGGYMTQGFPEAFLMFKTLSVQTLITCLTFTGNMKLGHYMKIPPRTMFVLQLVCTIVVGVTELAVKEAMLIHIPDICSNDHPFGLTCWSANVYFITSLLWSAIGPHHVFQGKAFKFILFGLLVGAVCPILTAILRWRYKKNWLSYVSWPIIFFSIGVLPLSHSVNFTSWFIVAFVFQYYIRRYHFRWWSKYNFVTANALDFGTVVADLIIFLAIQLPVGEYNVLNWWGNTVSFKNSDAFLQPLLTVPPGGIDENRAF